ncbi:MAG: hypothetical protein J4F37_13850 [Acidobacteria bacterium]|nr:hypothetical protein [Acidobacteriota bacterium]
MRSSLRTALIVTAMVSLVPLPAGAQEGAPAAPRTSWGAPDLQGVWDFRTATPLERPEELADIDVLTDEQAAEVIERLAERWTRLAEGSESDPGAYNQFWFDYGTSVTDDRRTSLVVDPPNGRIPALTADGEARAAARRDRRRDHPADSWEDRGIAERCILGFNAGPPMESSAYNNIMQVFQTPDHVVILNEMVNDSRIVPLDGRPHLPGDVEQWRGDSRGRWEGETLVIETTNFTAKTSVRGSGPGLNLVERLTRVDDGTLLYEYTVDDAATFERPWSVAMPMKRSADPVFEYACHEGNYGMEGILAGARADEREAAEAR